MSKLWYTKPAENWNEALPLGSGRLAAMVFGTPKQEHLQLNESSMWYGCHEDRHNPAALENLSKVRELIFDGRIRESEQLLKYAFSSTPQSMQPYQTLGDMEFNQFFEGDVRDYRRELNLDTALHYTTFTAGDVTFNRKIFASAADDVIALNFSASRPGALHFDVLLTRQRMYRRAWAEDEHTISISGDLGKDGLDFCLTLTGSCRGGCIRTQGEHIIVEGADEATLLFTAHTTNKISDPLSANLAVLRAASKHSFAMLEQRHVAEYRGYFARVQLTLGTDAATEALPTNERLARLRAGKTDNGLLQTYFDFGRYLLIACSRPGGMVPTLQGMWNPDLQPAWESKYTVNINTEMNYWMAESANLSECHLPLVEMVKALVTNGRETARRMYNCKGVVCHHNTNFWHDTAPQDVHIPATYWVLGAAFLCLDLWEHYDYNCNKEYLREVYPVMREIVEFFEDFLVEHNGYLVTCPSVSPENTYRMESGETGSVCAGPAMDNQILRELFSNVICATEILDIDKEFRGKVVTMRARLRPDGIGRHGQLLEWGEDYEEVEPGHRHVSHLFALYPAWQISRDATPDLAEAARVTLERRLSKGGGHTGWSRAWIINLYARLWDGEAAYNHLEKLLSLSTLDNMLDNHPPFQIDGNFGGAAGMVEMLLQSSPKRTLLLPALPKAWPNGSVTGLKMRGNVTVSLYWLDGRLSRALLRPTYTGNHYVGYSGVVIPLHLTAGQTTELSPDDFILTAKGKET